MPLFPQPTRALSPRTAFRRRAAVAGLRLMLAGACAAAGACSSTEPVAYRGLTSAPYLAANTGEDSARVPFRYAQPVDWHAYNRVILERVTAYAGPDAQFGSLSSDDKAALAEYMQTQFAQRLGSRFALASDPGPGTLRIKITLTGATTNTPVLSTFSHLDLGGNLVNGVQAIRGHEGLISGAVFYAVEITDTATGRLLAASVARQYPNALNIPSSFGALAAAKAGIDKGADALVTELTPPARS